MLLAATVKRNVVVHMIQNLDVCYVEQVLASLPVGVHIQLSAPQKRHAHAGGPRTPRTSGLHWKRWPLFRRVSQRKGRTSRSSKHSFFTCGRSYLERS